jgi:putative Mn2+ efflux pump MntP
MIAMTKGVQSLMAKMGSEFSVAIRQHIYAEMQDFVGGTLRELLAKAIKHKKDVLSGILMVIEGK